jgi:hypothetical protein
MTKTKENLAAAEQLIKGILQKNFGQRVEASELRAAAEKIVESVPGPLIKPVKQVA